MNESKDAQRIMNESKDAQRIMNESKDDWRGLVLSVPASHSSGESEVLPECKCWGNQDATIGSSYRNGLTIV